MSMKIHFDNTVPEYLIESFESNAFVTSTLEDAEIIYPAGKGATKRLKEYITQNTNRQYCQIPGFEYLGAKDFLWIKNVLRLGKPKALDFLPSTYLLRAKSDQHSLEQIALNDPERQLILKSNQQKRKGLKLIKAKELTAINFEDYKVAQEIIQCSKKHTNRAFNIRSYIIVRLENGILNASLSQNGKFIYASSDEIISNNENQAINNEPVFIKDLDFKEQLIINEQLTRIVNDCILSIFKNIQEHDANKQITATQLLGIDFTLDEQEKIKILEINFRPQMNAFNENEVVFKTQHLNDYIQLIKGTALNENWLTISSQPI